MTSTWPPVSDSAHGRMGLFLRLDQLDPIAEGIAKFEAVVAGDGNRIEHFDPRTLQVGPPLSKIGHFISNVRFGGGAVDVFFDADVKLMLAGRKPQAAAGLQRLRFGISFRPRMLQ